MKEINKNLNVLLVDDDVLFTQGLKHLINVLRKNIVFFEASNIEEALKIESVKPIDLVLVDYFFRGSKLSKLGGVNAITNYFDHSTIVIISGMDVADCQSQNITIETLISNGVSGFIHKSSSSAELISALNQILTGVHYFPKFLVYSDNTTMEKKARRSILDRLTKRQQMILEMACKGTPNKVIADEIHVAEGTVKSHLSVIYKLLNVKNRTEAARLISSLEVIDHSVT